MIRNNSESSPLVAASDTLNRAAHILRYVINNRTREDDPGEGWTLGVVEDAIDEAKRLIDGAVETLKVAK